MIILITNVKMAKIVFSGIAVTNARNKEGDYVYSRNRGGNVKRAYVIPTNTITPARTNIRDLMAFCNNLWQLLNDGERYMWNQATLKFRKKDVLGNYYFQSGYSYFIKTAFILTYQGLAMTTEPPRWLLPTPINSAFTTLLDATNFLIQINFPFGSHTVPDPCNLVVSATDSMSAGITYCTTRFQIIAIYPVLTATNPLDIFTDYSFIWGAPITGKKIFVKVQLWSTKCGAQSRPIIFGHTVS